MMVASSSSVETSFTHADAVPLTVPSETSLPDDRRRAADTVNSDDVAVVVNDAIDEQVARANRWRFLRWDDELRAWQHARQQRSHALPVTIDAAAPLLQDTIERPWLITQCGFVSGVMHAICIIVMGTLTWVTVAERPWSVVATRATDVPDIVEITLPEVEQQAFAIDDVAASASALQVAFIPAVSIQRNELLYAEGESQTTRATTTMGDEVRSLLGNVDAGASPAALQGGGASFFGTDAAGTDFVFVVDCSMSMKGLKWKTASDELLRAIESLGEKRRFYVIFFDRDSHRMFEPASAEQELLPATEYNVRRLRNWVSMFQLGYETEPFFSVRQALDFMPDAIFLLSDGDFSDPTAAYLRKNNFVHEDGVLRMPAVAVHTIGLHDRDGQKVLMRIAKENRGSYRFVPGE